jgi:AcrR family transcriptional regulator
MPRLIETESRTGAVVAAVNHLLATGGPASLSIRSIARESGVSSSSLLHHYGSRQRIVHLSALRTGRARIRDIDRRIDTDGAIAFLPVDDDGVLHTRAWLAWLELWRSEEILDTGIEGIRADERGILARALDYRLGRDDLTTVLALVDGLLVAICAPVRPLPFPRACAILDTQVGHALARAS